MNIVYIRAKIILRRDSRDEKCGIVKGVETIRTRIFIPKGDGIVSGEAVRIVGCWGIPNNMMRGAGDQNANRDCSKQRKTNAPFFDHVTIIAVDITIENRAINVVSLLINYGVPLLVEAVDGGRI